MKLKTVDAMRIVVTIIRIITGLLFIFSGLVKAIDPRGLAYKMQEFFEVFGREGYFTSGMNWFSNYALAFSIFIITLEVLLGVAVLLGWQKKLTAVFLLLLMLLFTFLTSFVLFSGKIKACGCFGDCIPITPVQTFIKDIILLLFVLILLFFQRFIRPINKPLILILILLVAGIFTIALQLHVLKNLPLVDCLPFKKGNNILDLRKTPADAVPDEYSYTFIYTKDGVKKEFKADALPDSTWTFSDRTQVLIKEGKNNMPLINDFKLNDADGADSTEIILRSTSLYYLFFLEFNEPFGNKWQNDFKKFVQANNQLKKIYLITSQRKAAQIFLQQNNIELNGIFTSDATAIKTAARSNPALYLMQGPVVKEKWGWAGFDEATEFIKKHN
ncbi:MAG: BT_3928 family protein [Ferruginibacter sp.]